MDRGVRYLRRMNKTVEIGLKATGMIDGGQQGGVSVWQVIVLPMAREMPKLVRAR
jgi:hypothetical protein